MAAFIQVLQPVCVIVCQFVMPGHHVHHQLVDGTHHHSDCHYAVLLCQLQEARCQLGIVWTGLPLLTGAA